MRIPILAAAGAAAVLGLVSEAAAAAPETVVVLGSDLPAYKEALAGFSEAFPEPFAVVLLKDGPLRFDPQTRGVVAIGYKATGAVADLPGLKVSVLAAGLAAGEGRGTHVRVSLCPPPAEAVAQLRRLRPGLRRVGVLWSYEDFRPWVEGFARAAQAEGLGAEASRLPDPEAVPARLRSWAGQVDALWLVPDPVLVTPEYLMMLREYAQSAHVPLFASLAGLTEKGAAAAVTVPYREQGRAAARALLAARAGSAPAPVVFGEGIEVFVNPAAAARSGLRFPPAVLESARRVGP